MNIDITGLDKAAVLAALYNRAQPQGMGYMHYNPQPMTVDEARQMLDGLKPHQMYFDYVQGRVMKVDLSRDDAVSVRLYDRDNGAGAGEAAIASIRR